MFRAVVGILGVVTTLFPERIIDVFEGVAIDNPGESVTKPWTGAWIRAEGIVVTIVSLVGGRAFHRMTDLMGVFGVIVLTFPRLYHRFASAFLYENPDEIDWNSRFTSSVRIIGALYVLLAIRAFTKRRDNR